MSSKASLRNIIRKEEKKGYRNIRRGFFKEMNILKESKQKYFYIQFNRIITLAENNALGVSKEDLISLMENYIKENKRPEV